MSESGNHNQDRTLTPIQRKTLAAAAAVVTLTSLEVAHPSTEVTANPVSWVAGPINKAAETASSVSSNSVKKLEDSSVLQKITGADKLQGYINQPGTIPDGKYVTYKVESGDTAGTIADNFTMEGLSHADLQQEISNQGKLDGHGLSDTQTVRIEDRLITEPDHPAAVQSQPRH